MGSSYYPKLRFVFFFIFVNLAFFEKFIIRLSGKKILLHSGRTFKSPPLETDRNAIGDRCIVTLNKKDR